MYLHVCAYTSIVRCLGTGAVLPGPFGRAQCPAHSGYLMGVLWNKAQGEKRHRLRSGAQSPRPPTDLDRDFPNALARDSPEEPPLARGDSAFISPAAIGAASGTNASCAARKGNAKETRGRSGSSGDAATPLPSAPHPLRPLHPLHLLNIQDMALSG